MKDDVRSSEAAIICTNERKFGESRNKILRARELKLEF
jgi:hypothetical protein